MEFNPDPTKQATEVLFSCKKSSKPTHPPLVFNGSVVHNKNEQKPLGLILDSGLSFAKHLNEKIKKAKKIIGTIKHLSKYLPLKTLNQMYKAFVRPHLDYCDIIYHISSFLNQPSLGVSLNHLMEQIEKIQYQAALAVTGAWQGSNRSQIYEEFGWESLSDRRMSRRILQIYKIINAMTPSYLKDKLPPNKRPTDLVLIFVTLREIRCRSARFMNSFYPNGVASWNIIIKHFDTMPSISKLKEHLLSLFRPNIKSTFKVTQPLQNDKNCQKYDFPDFCLILIFNQRTTFCEILGVKILAEML